MKSETEQLLALRAEEEQNMRNAFESETRESQDRYHQAARNLGFEPQGEDNNDKQKE